MKIKSGFILREIAGTHVVVPIGQNVVELSIMLTLNESGAFIWKQLETETTQEEIEKKLISEYGIGQKEASEDLEAFLSILHERKLIDIQ